ncbi:hypothetical protein [Winogradskyella algicola]|jgi:hypothetical protein|uniref:hypothetical protein n=1 Tax=Winogradskyella algicola TaxID=2575815 RepID=UPI001BB2306B|nr:hypothetical protein [Winogradskyella algicola]
MKKLSIYTLLTLFIATFYNCEEQELASEFNYVTFESGPTKFDVVKDATSDRDISVYSANKTGSDRTFMIQVDQSSTLLANYTVPSSVTIPANSNEGTFSISVTDDDNLGFVTQELILDFVDESGVNLSDPLIIEVTEECLDTIVSLSLTFDDWAEECTWEIYDLADTSSPIFSGGNGGEYDALDNTTFGLDFCLASGSYGIVVYDSYGDGGTTFEVTSLGSTLASGAVPGGNPANVPTQTSSTFTIN